MTKTALEPCPKCKGTGSYRYDENHGKVCEVCCPCDQGWWLLREHYGDDNGKYCCKRGCGKTKWPEELGLDAPKFVENTRAPVTDKTAQPVAWMNAKEIAAEALLDACEGDPADPEHPDTICITTDDFETVVRCAVENWRETHPPATDPLMDEVREALHMAMLELGSHGACPACINAHSGLHAILAKLGGKP